MEHPTLNVRMYLDIQRRMGDTTATGELIGLFCNRFKTTQWPTGRPFPEVYYDPRSLALDRNQSATLHAKCVVVDRRDVFVSSANFTEAAQQRNIEIGLLLHSEIIAERITRFFDYLRDANQLERVF